MRPQPRLSRLLKRNVKYEVVGQEHLPYLWAAYRKGAFNIVHQSFENSLTKEEFLSALVDYMELNVLAGFVYFADINGKSIPVGYGLFWERGRIFQTENLIWFPWANSRAILETYVNFIVKMRSEKHESGHNYVILEYAMQKDQKFFDHVCKYGVMRRVGTSLEVYPGSKSCIYESRSVD